MEKPAAVRQPTVFTGPLEAPYVSACHRLLREIAGDVRFEPWHENRVQMLRSPRNSLLHLHWIEWAFRGRSLPRSVLRSAQLVVLVLLLRLRGVPTVWTVHNPAGKGHHRRWLDRSVRSALALLARHCIVLNPEAIPLAAHDLHPFARRRFLKRCSVVPHPVVIRDHGRPVSVEEGRTSIGLDSDGPVVLYLPGANQLDQRERFPDREGRYRLLVLDRSAASGVSRTEWGWTFGGTPDDHAYGLLIAAADAVLLGDPTAFGSSTVHAAASMRRPVFGARCPALTEAAGLGLAFVTDDLPTPDQIAANLSAVDTDRVLDAIERFAAAHRDELVAVCLRDVYRASGLNI